MKRKSLLKGLAIVSCVLGGAAAAAADGILLGSTDSSSYYAEGGQPADAAGDTTRFLSDSNCGDCLDSCCKGPLLGFIAPSDDGFGCFISPMTNPVYFEDPRTLTEARAIFIQHKIPLRAPLAGGDVQLIACQFRAALSEDLSIIATKDGFIINGSDGPGQDGWANVNAGLKYNLYKDYERQRILSAALVFEMPVGSTRALQGNGSGVFDLILTGAAQLNDYWRTVAAAGLRLPSDVVDNSQSSYVSVHFDRTIGNRGLYFLNEYNWYHWMRSGQNGIPGVEGLDLYNFGSTGVAGNNIVTGAIGLKYRPNFNREFGLAWEVPLTERRDILDNRITVDAIFRY